MNRRLSQFYALRSNESTRSIVLALTGPTWSWMQTDEANARALFEAAIGDASYSEQELIDATRTFIQIHNEKNSLFGRLAADLDTLVSLIADDASGEYVEIARAALTYFVETADAIPDDLGFVGLLDDAYIVQQAVDQISTRTIEPYRIPRRPSKTMAVSEESWILSSTDGRPRFLTTC